MESGKKITSLSVRVPQASGGKSAITSLRYRGGNVMESKNAVSGSASKLAKVGSKKL